MSSAYSCVFFSFPFYFNYIYIHKRSKIYPFSLPSLFSLFHPNPLGFRRQLPETFRLKDLRSLDRVTPRIFFRIPGFRPSFPAPRIPHNIGLKSPAKDPWRGVYWFNPKQNPVNKSVEKEASGCCLVVGRLTDFDVLFWQSTGNALYLVMNNKVMQISYIYWKEKTLVMI